MNLEILFILFIFLAILYFPLSKMIKIKFFRESLGMTLFSVKMLKYEKPEEKAKQDFKNLISQMEQFYAYFLNLKKKGILDFKSRVVLEIASRTGAEDVTFYVAVPDFLESSLPKLIQGIYPRAVVEKVPQDYTIFEPQGKVAASYLSLKNTFFLPLNTFRNLEQDPLLAITNAISAIKLEEGAAVQIIFRGTKFNLQEKGEKVLAEINEGMTLKGAITKAKRHWILKGIIEVIDIILEGTKHLTTPTHKDEETVSRKEITPKTKKVDDATIEALRSKIKKPSLEANIRLIGVAPTQERANEILRHLESAFSQFSSVYNNFTVKRVTKRRLQELLFDFIYRNFNEKEKIFLNLEELSSIYHFPLPHIEVSGLEWQRTKDVPPPVELPTQGLILIGKAIYQGETKPVFFASREDRRRHFYIIGQTGTGKTSLLREMIRQDIENGEGVGVIDPHGDLIEDTLANIPKERIDDVILFEPFDMERPMGLNMLEWETPEQRDFAVSEMIQIFHKLFPPEIIGPMFEHYMRNAMLAVMADHYGTLVDIPRIFTDEDFMEWKLEKVTDPLVRNFWLREWRQTIGQTRSDMLGYVVSKVGRFVENEMMRNIIGQAKSSFNLTEIMDEGKIFLANLSKGQTGELNSSLLGLILVSKMQIAAMARAKIPEEKRRDFYLYIDEFQNFTTDSIATILSEARKYRLNLILAHQYIPQLPDPIKHAVVGNVGTLAAFRIGAQDAEFVEKIFEPEFSKFDLLNLDNFTLVIRMMVNGKITTPFKLMTIKPKSGNYEMVPLVKKISKFKYARPRDVVEREIMERSRLAEL